MKDVTSTSFGLVIAFLLPGLACFYALSLWFTKLREVLHKFLTTDANAGLFLLVLLTAISLGLLLSPFRYYLYERWLCKNYKLDTPDFSKLKQGGTLEAFRAAVDEYYRYHQFWGGMSIAMLIAYLGWLKNSWESDSISIALSFVLFFLIESVTVLAAVDAYKNYVTKTRPIMKGE